MTITRLTYTDLSRAADLLSRQRKDRHLLALEIGKVSLLLERRGAREDSIPPPFSPHMPKLVPASERRFKRALESLLGRIETEAKTPGVIPLDVWDLTQAVRAAQETPADDAEVPR